MDKEGSQLIRGLEGVVAAETQLCDLDLPAAGALDRTMVALVAAREIPREVVEAFRLMPRDTDPMRALQAAAAVLGMHDPDATDNSHAANLRKAVRLTSQIATAICAHHRVRTGQSTIPGAPDLG